MTVLLYGALYAASYLIILPCELRLGYSAAQAGATGRFTQTVKASPAGSGYGRLGVGVIPRTVRQEILN